MLLIGCLEEAKLVAVLVSPLPQATVDVDGSVTEGSRVVLGVQEALALTKLGNCLKQVGWGVVVRGQILAHRDS